MGFAAAADDLRDILLGLRRLEARERDSVAKLTAKFGRAADVRRQEARLRRLAASIPAFQRMLETITADEAARHPLDTPAVIPDQPQGQE